MVNEIPLNENPITLDRLFNSQEKFAFLAGAGISMESPTNLPSARQIVKCLFECFAPQEEVSTLLELPNLRYEQVVENLQRSFDPELKFMDYFDLIKKPNPIHDFLASMILRRESVITTNFDYLIEYALLNILPKKKYHQIKPVIIKDDYYSYIKNLKSIRKSNLQSYFLAKLHGSNKNILTKKPTKSSLVTTISALGRNREAGQTFAIEPFKKPVLQSLLANRTLIVLGYSGRDDFDIGPTLKELLGLKKIFWIDHWAKKESKIEFFDGDRIITQLSSSAPTSDLDIFLSQIAKNQQIEVVKVKTNTGRFINQELLPRLVGDKSRVKMDVKSTQNPDFLDWLKSNFPKISLARKYIFAGSLFKELGNFTALLRIAEKGIEITEKHDQKSKIAPFYDFMALYYHRQGNYQKAHEYCEKELELEEKEGNSENKAVILNNLAGNFLNLGNLQKGLELYEQAIKIHKNSNNLEPVAIILNNIAIIHTIQGDLEGALIKNEEALKINETIGNLAGKAKCLSDIGWIYHMQGKLIEAMEKHKIALRIEEEIGDLWGISSRLVDIGNVYKSQKNFEQALFTFNKALVHQEKIQDLSSLASIYNNIGSIHIAQGDLEKAQDYIQKSYDIRVQLGESRGKATVLLSLGDILVKQQNYNKAKTHFQEANELYEKIQDLNGLATSLYKLGIAEFLSGDNQKAKSCIDNSLKYFKKLGNEQEITQIKKVLDQLKL